MKVALVHDYIKEYGGAERVLETLHEMYPDAPVYTSVYCPEFLGPHKKRFRDWEIHESFLKWIPFKHKFISLYRLVSPFVFASFDLSGYDVVIVSATGAYCPNMVTYGSGFRVKPGMTKVICYCHTPPRYLYGYATAREWKKNPLIKIGAMLMSHVLRIVDFKSAQRVDQFVANSEEVKARIEKFYRKDAVVVYPPVSINPKSQSTSSKQMQNTKYQILNTDYYLAGGRLARPKHFDLIIKACAELGVSLKIFGRGFAGYEEELREIADKCHPGEATTSIGSRKDSIALLQNDGESLIQFVGEVTDEEKLSLMKGAKAFFFAGEDEDFGIVPVEAMGVGTPVIAYRSGGVKETVVDPSASSGQVGPTGVFFDKLTVESVVVAVKKFERLKIKREDCIARAQKFSKAHFEKGIKSIVSHTAKE